MDESPFLSSESDEDDSLIVAKKRRILALFDDSDDEDEDAYQGLGNANLARSEDDILSDDSDASAQTEVIADTDNLMTDVAAADEDLNNLVNSTDADYSARRDDVDDDELLSIHSEDEENYNQEAEVESFDSDETNFEEPVVRAGTSPPSPSPSPNELGTSASFFSSSMTKTLRTRTSSSMEATEVEDEALASASSSSTSYEPSSSTSSSADFGSDTDFKVSRNQRKKVAPLTQSAPLSFFSPVKFETISDEDDDDFDPVIPAPRRDQAPPPLTTEPRWINVDDSPDFGTPPPVYNPSATSKADWRGDVQRTVHMMDETIKGMPLPDDEDKEDVKLPPGLVELFPHQKYALRWMSWREVQFPGGGILADEMGLGKTIEIIALIMKSKWENGVRVGVGGKDTKMITNEEAGPRCVPSCTTLVVCPLGCIPQWCREMETKGKNLRVHTYHGTKKLTSAAEIAKYDVVVTTYQTIANEIPKSTEQKPRRCRSPLKRVYWVRIVLDEAHQIRNPKTNAAQALYQLEARHRWAVTGTPIHNRPEDFYSMCTFLRLEPFNDRQVWDFWIGLKTVKRGAEQRLHVLGKALILRRTKEEVGLMAAEGGDGDGNRKVQVIPPKSVEVVNIELREEERRIYDMLMDYAKSILKEFLSQKEQREHGLRLGGLIYASDRVQERREECPEDIKFSHIFALLTRLRQCAVLPHLIETMLDREEIGEDEKFDELKPEHIVSKINPVFDRLYLSSKFEKIIEDVDQLRANAAASGEPMDKVIIVSSWTSTLDIIYEHLRNKDYSCVFITGRDDMNLRMDNMDRFNKNKWRPQVLLLSLMAGGVGLNLIGANHVFFVEPHWNPQHELQAQDRVHRFGQMKNVHIRRYITDETIESRIMDLQKVKKELADGLLSNSKRGRGAGISLEQMKRLFEI